MTRLIDADALKEEMSKVFFNDNDDMIRLEKLIDNAPTVDMYERDADAFESGYIEGLNADKPKGKWIEFADYVARNVVNEDFSEDVDLYAEVLCRKLVKLGLVKLDGDTYKYCGNDMGGEEE